MESAPHRPLCTIELIAEGHAERCSGDACPFWQDGCVLDRVSHELDGRREVAEFLLGLRRELEHPQREEIEEARAAFHRRLAAGRE